MFVPKVILRPLLPTYNENNFYNSEVSLAPHIIFSIDTIYQISFYSRMLEITGNFQYLIGGFFTFKNGNFI